MKNIFRPLLVFLGFAAHSVLADEAGKSVAFRSVADDHYVTSVPNVGLNLNGTSIGKYQTFTILDLNGGEIADGDEIRIKAGEKFWCETPEKIERVDKAGQPGNFFVKKTDAGIILETFSGKFVTSPSLSEPLTATDSKESALVFEIIENP